tara:strand:+ start:829 stop:1041 length:213 start_codon:yes stop_codon:yes gene_type:complete
MDAQRKGEVMESYKISILWGESPNDGEESITYKFNTKLEIDAFLLGIAEMNGWNGWEEVKEGYIHSEGGE